MRVRCPKCKAGYQIDISKIPAIPEGGITTTCPKCKGEIPIKLESDESTEAINEQLIPCPDCGHINISTKSCTQCGKVFSKEELEKMTIRIGS